MNKVITDGVTLMPADFADGLDVWSDQDGTPGSTTYDGAANAAFVPADADFGGCLEMTKTSATQKLRFMGETPLSAGCYLKISARIKAMSGNLPTVQIAAWAGDSGNNHVSGLTEVGTAAALTTYGEVVTVEAYVGAGNRTGVDMIWGTTPTYGHFGLDLTGPDGGVVRIESIVIEDATNVFHRKLMDWVDVRDYGAIGDGVADDFAAFEAADTAAGGRTVFVSEGTYLIGSNITIDSEIRFEGTVTMADAVRFSMVKNFDLPTYVEAFGNEVLGLKKGLQALFNFTDHESLDMCGRRIELDAPIDVHAVVDNKDTFANRRVLKNGQLGVIPGANWDNEVFSSSASYSTGTKTELSNVTNVASIPVGSLVTGTGVGREIYVRSKDVGAGTIELSAPLYAAPASQTYTFERFKYLLDFSGFTSLTRFVLSDIEFLCQGNCSGVLLPSDGLIFQVKDCFFTTPKNRGLTSSGNGCAGLMLDRNQFLSDEQTTDAVDRISIGFNVNANDAKIRNNRASRFLHFGVLHGVSNIITGNHFFQGDSSPAGLRTAGIILTENSCNTIISNNYIDNCFVEWTNEIDETPDHVSGFSFGALTIDSNNFYSSGSAAWFRFIQIKPYGTNHYINGVNISGNVFKHAGGGTLQRVEAVDASIAPLDMGLARNILVAGNTFNSIDDRSYNPVTLDSSEATTSATWTVDFSKYLPFGGYAREVMSVVPEGKIKNASSVGVFTQPYALVRKGVNENQIELKWSEAVTGKVQVTARMDNMT